MIEQSTELLSCGVALIHVVTGHLLSFGFVWCPAVHCHSIHFHIRIVSFCPFSCVSVSFDL